MHRYDSPHTRHLPSRFISALVLVTLVLAVSGCTTGPSKRSSEPKPGTNTDAKDAMFRTLSSHEWCADPSLELSSHIKLFPNGRHETYQFNDEALPPSAGPWNFHQYSNTEGVLYLTSEEWTDTRAAETRIVIFRLSTPNELDIEGGFTSLSGTRLQRCKALPGLSPSTADSLPPIALPQPVASLAGTEWILDSELPHGAVPSKIRFDDFGSLVLTLPSGVCKTYGWPVEQTSRGCRKRAAFNPYHFRTVGRLLIHQQEPYRRSTDNSPERTLWLAFTDVEGRVTYQPPLWKRPQTFHIELWGAPHGLHLKGTLVLSVISASGGRSTETILTTLDYDTVVGPERVATKDIVVDALPTSSPSSPYSLHFMLRAAELPESSCFFTHFPR